MQLNINSIQETSPGFDQLATNTDHIAPLLNPMPRTNYAQAGQVRVPPTRPTDAVRLGIVVRADWLASADPPSKKTILWGNSKAVAI